MCSLSQTYNRVGCAAVLCNYFIQLGFLIRKPPWCQDGDEIKFCFSTKTKKASFPCHVCTLRIDYSNEQISQRMVLDARPRSAPCCRWKDYRSCNDHVNEGPEEGSHYWISYWENHAVTWRSLVYIPQVYPSWTLVYLRISPSGLHCRGARAFTSSCFICFHLFSSVPGGRGLH